MKRWVGGRNDPNVIAIPGARSVSQGEENTAAAGIRLSEDDYALLSSAADRFRDAT